jgi:hypothetical protein
MGGLLNSGVSRTAQRRSGIMVGGLLVCGPGRCPSRESGTLHAGVERGTDDAGAGVERSEY